jgi:hypothetical protein
MRIGRRMKQILTILSQNDGPLTLTEIILKIYKVNPYQLGSEEGMMIASSFTGKLMAGEMAQSFARLKGQKSKKGYHPVGFAGLLYANYSRAMKTLVDERRVSWTHNKRFHYRYAKAYVITDEGRANATQKE